MQSWIDYTKKAKSPKTSTEPPKNLSAKNEELSHKQQADQVAQEIVDYLHQLPADHRVRY